MICDMKPEEYYDEVCLYCGEGWFHEVGMGVSTCPHCGAPHGEDDLELEEA